MPATERIKYLTRLFFQDACTAAERTELSEWISSQPDEQVMEALLQEEWQTHSPVQSMPEAMATRILGSVFGEETPVVPLSPEKQSPARIRLRRLQWAAAVLLLGCLGLTAWWLLQRNQRADLPTDTGMVRIPPGQEGAVLTLQDGRQLLLDTLGNGTVLAQAGSRLTLENGQLRYQPSTNTGTAIAYNTMTTPPGRKFRVQLPDGTAAWLNAGSSITYPTQFSGTDRKVSISGEVYVEVSREDARPFTIEAGNFLRLAAPGMQVNINCYADERVVAATVLNGSVSVYSIQGNRQQQLYTGQRVILDRQQPASMLQLQTPADAAQAIAWKNGLLSFQDKHLAEVMRLLARWYNLEVIIDKEVRDVEFWGEVGADLELDQVLKVLEDAGVHFRLEPGRRLHVLP
ncbi:MAG: DUF4974 domain-containing protein [Candidatus Pseudobacter hemicellulosilyticus]|uniref:DUF4974 domain-containing protein n=1 Tax=Candidatus Pseudobacter hemicellulosilyticus TaxID=3121375 RepID=A0AAJ5WWS6_9BACT|nr:MAG: DUF4974 domain-containing protein [Pseudobacter sp.]